MTRLYQSSSLLIPRNRILYEISYVLFYINDFVICSYGGLRSFKHLGYWFLKLGHIIIIVKYKNLASKWSVIGTKGAVFMTTFWPWKILSLPWMSTILFLSVLTRNLAARIDWRLTASNKKNKSCDDLSLTIVTISKEMITMLSYSEDKHVFNVL